MLISSAVFHQSQYVPESQLDDPDPNCPFCGCTYRRRLSLLQQDPDIWMLHCTNCYACSASWMPKLRALTDYYNSCYCGASKAKKDGRVTFDNINRFADYLATCFLSDSTIINKTVSILDFGGGDGSITLELGRRLVGKGFKRIDILVVDYNKETVASSDNRITIRRADSLPVEASSFQFVIASAIIKHLPSPKKSLDGLIGCLGSGGLLYLRTPYMVPLSRFLAKIGVKLDLTYPAHLHDLGQNFWGVGFPKLYDDSYYRMLISRPSIVKTSFKAHFLKSLVAYAMKAPWYLWSRWRLVGGWEVIIKRS